MSIFDDDEKTEFKKLTREEEKRERNKIHNERQKKTARLIGENLVSFILIVVPLLLIGFVWTDPGLPKFNITLIYDGGISIALFIIAEVCTASIGVEGGKQDDDYINIHKDYLSLSERLRQRGIALMDTFCLWQIDLEFDHFMRRKCKKLRVDYDEYNDKWSKMSLKDITDERGKYFAGKIELLNRIEPISLSTELLMTDGKVNENGRGGVGISGQEYVEKKTRGWKHILSTAICAVGTCVFTLALTDDISFGRIVYTVFKLAVLVFRMYTGYSRGSKAYNQIEIKHITDKMRYQQLYTEFLDSKTYIKLGDKYGDISDLYPSEPEPEEPEPEKTEPEDTEEEIFEENPA